MLVVIASAFCSWCLILIFLPTLRQFLPDHPNTRSSHFSTIPRGGGLSFVLVASLFSLVAFLTGNDHALSFLPLLAFPLAIVGLFDDRLHLSMSFRYILQFITASLLLFYSPLVSFAGFPLISIKWLVLPLMLLAISITAVINFVNFMDGLDGLVCGCLVVTFASLAFSLDGPWALWALVGSLLGFLIWNWSPAKVFMGDVGSTYLGAVFAGYVLQASNWSEALSYLLVATPLLADALFCVLRRLLSRQPIFQAHRLHLFQRLNQAGWPHARVSSLYIFATTVLALSMLLGGLPWVFAFSVTELLVGLWLDQRVAVPFALASNY